MKTQRGQTLVATLAVLAIMCLLAVALFKGSGAFSSGKPASSRPDGKGTTVLGAAQWKAKDEVCRSNMNQVRSALKVLSINEDDSAPQDIRETKLPSEFYSCPVGKEAYTYDPAAGTVSCPHPGHEKF
jgi:hypothetical protein